MLDKFKIILGILLISVLSQLCISCGNSNANDETLHKCEDNSKESYPNQTEMNISAYNEFLYADSLLDIAFNKAIIKYETAIAEEREIAERVSDYDMEYLNYLIEVKKSLQSNQEAFLLYRESLQQMIGEVYTGGSMSSMVVNDYKTLITNNQTKLLEELFK